MRALPIHVALHMYFSCCGKTICCGCNHEHQMKSPETRNSCAFCRTALPKNAEALLARLGKRIERNDSTALLNMSGHYGNVWHGLPVNEAKSIELLRKSVALGCPAAKYKLAHFHENGAMGLEQNKHEACKHYKEAAEEGIVYAWHSLGRIEEENGDRVAAMCHWRLSASWGHRRSTATLIEYFEYGLLHHGDLAETLQSAYRARAELKSDGRDQYIAHLKETGEYEAEYEM